MSLLGKLFGEKASDANEQSAVDLVSEASRPQVELEPVRELTAVVEPSEQAIEPVARVEEPTLPEAIRAFDQDGHEVMVPREEWRTNVLPGMVKELWEQPDQLYMVILNSLNDGFVAEMTEAAAHLYEIDTVPARGACMWGVVLIQLGRLNEAEQVLGGFTETHGEDGSVLVNLAKVYAARGEVERAEVTLWRSLEVEPNLDNGLGWYASAAQERGGEQGAREALERVAQMPASWRAQLWLARAELTAQNVSRAKELYVEALGRAPRPVPPDFLMQMSGDLGGHGQLRELIELTGPHFVPEVHGLPIGNNLMKALLDTGNHEPAARVKNALMQLNRPDWKDALAFWDSEIQRRRSAGGAAAGAVPEIQIGMLRIDGPVWLPPGASARSIFGAKAAGAPSVTFLGGTAEAPQEAEQAGAADGMGSATDVLGKMTRALPLYLAEQTEMRTAAAGRAMLPWAVAGAASPGADGSAQPSGFVVSGSQWPDETAVQAAAADPANRSEYVVAVHLDAEVEPWTAELAFVRMSDGLRIGELHAEFAPGAPEEGLPRLADEVVELLSALGPATAARAYRVPEGAAFRAYLLGLEQLLTLRCATMDGVSPGFVSGERAMLESDFALALAEPENVAVRLLLGETLGATGKLRPEIAAEFQERYERLGDVLPDRPTMRGAVTS